MRLIERNETDEILRCKSSIGGHASLRPSRPNVSIRPIADIEAGRFKVFGSDAQPMDAEEAATLIAEPLGWTRDDADDSYAAKAESSFSWSWASHALME